MKIWCCFSVDNNYDQPDHNLVAWWREKPNLETFCRALGFELGKSDDMTIVNVVKIWAGTPLQITPGDTLYDLKEVAEGEVLEANAF